MPSVDITPSPRVLRMLGQIDFAPWQCLAELVDNSIDAFIDQDRGETPATDPRIWIRLPNDNELKDGTGEISVLDNGMGMSLETLQEAVRAGYSGNDPVEKMGLFGMGFNISTARMGRRTEVWTTRQDDPDWTGLIIDFGQLEKQKTFTAPVERRAKSEKEIEDGAHGTEIRISRLESDRVRPLIWGIGKRKTRDRLGKVYGRVMQRLDIKLNYGGDIVRPVKHCVWSKTRSVDTKAFGRVPARIEIDESLDSRTFCSTCWVWLLEDEKTCSACGHDEHVVKRSRRLKGWIGIQRYFDKEKFGIDLIRNGRVIEELDKSLFRYLGADGDPLHEYPIDAIHWGGRIVGELEIDFVRVSHQKDSFDKLDPEWKKVVELVRGTSPLQPQIAARMGLQKNGSPLARLFSAYRKSTAGLAALVPGNAEGRGLNTGLVKEYVDKFYEGDPDYQDDDKWYELVLQAERAKRGGGRGAAELAGDFPISGSKKLNSGDTSTIQGSGDSEEASEESGVTIASRGEIDRSLSGDYELPELLGDIVIKVSAFRHRSNIDDQPFRILPNGFTFKFDYNSDAQFFEDSVTTPLDYLLVDLAHYFLILSSKSPREMPISRISRMLREKYFSTEAGNVQDAAIAASNILNDLKHHFDDVLPRTAPIDLERISDHELENIRRSAFSSASLSPSQAEDLVRNGEFASHVSDEYLAELIGIWPGLVLDGAFFDRPYAQLAEEQKKDSVSQVIEGLRDVCWLAEGGATALNKGLDWRLRFTRALASVKLLESWKT
ncbi:MAG: ATP-binding protein [Albidovulum sp.]|nr:ATP-binding protein [Albidovulum sp.]